MAERTRRCTAALVLAALLGASAVFAQGYPAKPIRLIVPYPPGGIDQFARVLMPKAAEALGQPIVIDNRGGANGFIGAELLTRTPADGYSLGFMTSATMVGGMVLAANPPFDTVRDFTPVIRVLETLLVMTVSEAVPVNSVPELIDFAKRNPGKLSFGSSGVGSAFHLNGEKLKLATGIDMVHVPYKGSGPMATDILAGRVEVGFPGLNNVKAYLGAKKFKILAVMGSKRSAEIPDVPTIGEILPGYTAQTSWTAIFGPAKMPPAVVARLNGTFAKAADAPDFRKYLADNGAVGVAGAPEELAETLKADLKAVGDLVQRLRIPKE